jgi:hypothetical protein
VIGGKCEKHRTSRVENQAGDYKKTKRIAPLSWQAAPPIDSKNESDIIAEKTRALPNAKRFGGKSSGIKPLLQFWDAKNK